MQLDHFDPRWPTVGCTLLIEVLPFDSVRISHQHVRSAASTAQCSFTHSDVVPHEIELRMFRLREQHFVWIRDRNLAPGDNHSFSCAFFSHGQSLFAALSSQQRTSAPLRAAITSEDDEMSSLSL